MPLAFFAVEAAIRLDMTSRICPIASYPSECSPAAEVACTTHSAKAFSNSRTPPVRLRSIHPFSLRDAVTAESS
eukprot:6274983-Pyramimonas_sp.AAC.1